MMHTPRPGESQAVSRRPRLTLSTLLVVGSLVGATAANAASFYSLTDLGTLGGYWSYPVAINASGQVTGYAQSPSGYLHAFLYDGTTMRDLGTLGGYWSYPDAINASGQVAGTAQTPSGEYHPFLYNGTTMRELGGGSWVEPLAINDSGQVVGTVHYTPDGWPHAFLYDGTTMRELGTLGGIYSYARAINASGQVTGGAQTLSGWTHAYLYDGTTMRDLGTLGGSFSFGRAINASGQVAGNSYTPSGEYHPFLYDGTTMRDLGTLGGNYSYTWAINASGQVAGSSYTPSGDLNAFLYDGTTMRDLGTLGGSYSDAVAINASGQVVGTAQTPSGVMRAFLYDGTTMRDLNDLLDASGGGWTVWEAVDINDAGKIAAHAIHPNGNSNAVLLTPWKSVPIDITPGGSPNSINPRSQGKIPVAILSGPTFDAPAQVDQGSLTFGRRGDEPSLAFCSSGQADVNGDGWPDLVCHFHILTAAFQAGDTEGVLKGQTVAAVPFYGFDSVRIVPPR